MRAQPGGAVDARELREDRDGLEQSRLEAALAGVVGFHALAQALLLWSSAAGLRFSQGTALGLLGIALVAGLIFAFRLAGARPVASTAELPQGVSAPDDGRPRGLFRLLPAAAVLWLLWIWAQAWALAALRPPLDWDGLYYHLPALNGWTLARRVCWLDNVPDLPFANGYPMGLEGLGFLVHFALKTSRLVDGGNLLFWPLAVLGCAVLAGRLGARGGWRLFAGALVVGSPVFVAQSVTCYSDPAFAATVMAALAAACLLVCHDGRALGLRTLLAGAALGLVAGTKGAGAPYALILLIAVPLGGLRRDGWGAWRPWLVRTVAIAVVAFAVGGYWYARDVLRTGNPIFPIRLQLGMKVLAEGYDPIRMLADNLPDWLARVPSLLRAPYAWIQPDAPVVGYAPTTGLGYVWVAGGLPAAIWLWIRRRRRQRQAGSDLADLPEPAAQVRPHPLAFLILMCAVLFVAQPADWWGRFTVWLHALGLPCLAALLGGLAARGQRGAQRAAAFVAAAALLGVAAWESQTALTDAWRAGRDPASRDVRTMFLPTSEAFFPGLADSTGGTGAGSFLAADKLARSGWSRIGVLLGGTLAMPLGKREIAVVPDAPDDSEVTRLRWAAQWVVWDVVAAGPVPESLARAAVETRSYRAPPDTDFRFLKMGR